MATHFIVIVEYLDVQLGTQVDIFGPYLDIHSARDSQKAIQQEVKSAIAKAETEGFRVS